MTIDEALRSILAAHFPAAPATVDEIARFEAANGWRLDDEMRAFYFSCNGANLFRRTNSPYRILPLCEIQRARVAVFGVDDDRYGSSTMYTVCDNGDSDYVAVNVSSDEPYLLYDIFHEVGPFLNDCVVVATSFSEFLTRALGSDGRLYWLNAKTGHH